MTYQKSNSLRTLTHWQSAKHKIIQSNSVLDLIRDGVLFSIYFPGVSISDSELTDLYYIGPWLAPRDATGTQITNWAYSDGDITSTRQASGVTRAFSPGDSYIFNRYNQIDGYTYHWWIQSAGVSTLQVRPIPAKGDGPYKLHIYPGTVDARVVELPGKTCNVLLPQIHSFFVCGAYWSDSDDTTVLPDYMTDLDRAALDTNINDRGSGTTPFAAADHTASALTSPSSCDLACMALIGQVVEDGINFGDFLVDETFDGDISHLYPWAITPNTDYNGLYNYNLPLYGGFGTAAPVTMPRGDAEKEAATIAAIEAASSLGGGYQDVTYMSPGWWSSGTGGINSNPTSADNLSTLNDIYLGQYAYRQNGYYNLSATISSGIRSYTGQTGQVRVSSMDHIRELYSGAADSACYAPSYSFKRLTDGACFASMIQICTGYETQEGVQVIE